MDRGGFEGGVGAGFAEDYLLRLGIVENKGLLVTAAGCQISRRGMTPGAHTGRRSGSRSDCSERATWRQLVIKE